MATQTLTKLFSPYQLGAISLANRVAMAPMTRSRATADGVPTPIMAEYYAQRADAGLLITEGVAPAPEGLGYARIPGLYNDAQVAGWKAVAEAVHAKGGKIVAQLMHTGRVGHPANLPADTRLLAPSAIALSGQMWTDTAGMQDHPVPAEMTEAEIQAAIAAYADAARRAIEAGLDGVEIHGANGYLVDQFLNPASNQRQDRWGGSVENRIRFAVEVATATAAAIGGDRVGIRLSPYGAFNDMAVHDTLDETFTRLAEALAPTGIAYVHLVDHSAMGAPAVPDAIKAAIRRAFPRTLILSGGYDAARAEADLEAGKGDLVAFGRPFISNPDLVAKLRSGAALRPDDHATHYTPGPAGYTDYPVG